jgi:16S rRNA (adenine1518-N6/adenine1519-N6)-dimethyltransferase
VKLHRPRKRFGQNFLIDTAVIDAIVSALHPHRDDCLVEIGPGRGALTRPLLTQVETLHAIEIDRDLSAFLQAAFPQRLQLHVGDVLQYDFSQLGSNYRIVGNLPYNISTPLLFHLAENICGLRDMHLMLQQEVVERMVAAPSDSNYGRLSVMLQYTFSMEKLFDVAAAAFDPPPKVTSAVVRLSPLRPRPHAARDEALFAKVVAAAFSQRRKTLRNSLGAYFQEADFSRLGLDPGMRAQNLSVAQFVAAANYLAALRN